MLIPVNPSRHLVKSSKATGVDKDVHLEVIPYRDQPEPKVGQARVSGRTVIINRKGP